MVTALSALWSTTAGTATTGPSPSWNGPGRMAGMTQAELAEASGVNIRQIQRVELGEAETGNLTARNLIAIADALGVDVRSLI